MDFLSDYQNFDRTVEQCPFASNDALEVHRKALNTLLPKDQRKNIARKLAQALDHGQIQAKDLDDGGAPLDLKNYRAQKLEPREIDKAFSSLLDYFNRLCSFCYENYLQGNSNNVNRAFKKILESLFKFINQVYQKGKSLASVELIRDQVQGLRVKLEECEFKFGLKDKDYDGPQEFKIVNPNASTLINSDAETEAGNNSIQTLIKAELTQGAYKRYFDFIDFDSIPARAELIRADEDPDRIKLFKFKDRIFLHILQSGDGFIDYYKNFLSSERHANKDSSEVIDPMQLMKEKVDRLLAGENLSNSLSNKELWLELRRSIDEVPYPENQGSRTDDILFWLYNPNEFQEIKTRMEAETSFIVLEYMFASECGLKGLKQKLSEE